MEGDWAIDCVLSSVYSLLCLLQAKTEDSLFEYVCVALIPRLPVKRLLQYEHLQYETNIYDFMKRHGDE